MTPETQLQVDFVKWIRGEYPTLLFTSIQAGERRSKIAAMMMKRMGYTNGTPDLIFFASRLGWNGFLMELKTDKGKAGADQMSFKKQAEDNGYKYVFCFGMEQAKSALKKYMGGV